MFNAEELKLMEKTVFLQNVSRWLSGMYMHTPHTKYIFKGM